MNSPHRFVMSAVLTAVIFGCGNAGDPKTIGEFVRADDRFARLEDLLEEADLLETLDGEGPFTLFAATDDAFDALFARRTLAFAPQLAELAGYHVLEGQITTADLERVTALAPMDGPEIHVRRMIDGITLNDGVRLVAEPIVTENGIIHVVDAVLERPLIAPTRTYERLADIPFVDFLENPEQLPVIDYLVIEDTGFIHDLRVFVEIEHTDVSGLWVVLWHEETGRSMWLSKPSGSFRNDMNFTFADSAAHDIVADVVPAEDVVDEGQAYPEDSYRPHTPLETMVGETLSGPWGLAIHDVGAFGTGRLVRWGFIVSAGEEPPGPAIVLNPRTIGPTSLGRGFTETANIALQRVGGLEGDVEVNAVAGELVADSHTLRGGERSGAPVLRVPQDAELGPRTVVLSAQAGGVSRVVSYEATVAEPDALGIELLAHVPLPALTAVGGAEGNDIWGWTDPETGAEIALVGTSVGTAFVDISRPETPVVLGMLATQTRASKWRDVKVYRDHAFIVSEAWEHGLQVFDLTQLRGVTAPQSFAATVHNDEFGNAHNIAINEDTGFAYVLGSNYDECAGGLLMFDISTPTAPVSVGCFAGGVPVGQEPGEDYPLAVYTHDVQCVIYTGPDVDHQGKEVCFSSDETTVGIADVSDKANPVQLSRVTYADAGYTHQGWLTENHEYFILNDEYDEFTAERNTVSYVWDMRDLDAPVLVGLIENPSDAVGHNTYIKGRVAYQSNYSSGLRLVDLSDVESGTGTEVAYFDTHPNDDERRFSIRQGRNETDRGQLPPPGRVTPHHPDPSPGRREQSFRGAWSNYPFFESGVIVVSDIERGLFVLRRDATPSD